MEQKYWKQFTRTGKITDYLYYRGIEICRQVIDSHKDEKAHESDNCNGHGASGNSGR